MPTWELLGGGVDPHKATIPWPSALPAKERYMALAPGQSAGTGAWQILPLLFPACVTLGKPLHLSEHLDPHLENAYDPRFDERTKKHDVCGRALETEMSCKREAYDPLH